MISYKDIKNSASVKTYIEYADKSLSALGYTEHCYAHVGLVSERAEYILSEMGYGDKDIELVKIAALLHDIGNVVNRRDHSQSGAVMAFRILDNMGMDPEDIAKIVSAFNHLILFTFNSHYSASTFFSSAVALPLLTLADKLSIT